MSILHKCDVINLSTGTLCFASLVSEGQSTVWVLHECPANHKTCNPSRYESSDPAFKQVLSAPHSSLLHIFAVRDWRFSAAAGTSKPTVLIENADSASVAVVTPSVALRDEVLALIHQAQIEPHHESREKQGSQGARTAAPAPAPDPAVATPLVPALPPPPPPQDSRAETPPVPALPPPPPPPSRPQGASHVVVSSAVMCNNAPYTARLVSANDTVVLELLPRVDPNATSATAPSPALPPMPVQEWGFASKGGDLAVTPAPGCDARDVLLTFASIDECTEFLRLAVQSRRGSARVGRRSSVAPAPKQETPPTFPAVLASAGGLGAETAHVLFACVLTREKEQLLGKSNKQYVAAIVKTGTQRCLRGWPSGAAVTVAGQPVPPLDEVPAFEYDITSPSFTVRATAASAIVVGDGKEHLVFDSPLQRDECLELMSLAASLQRRPSVSTDGKPNAALGADRTRRRSVAQALFPRDAADAPPRFPAIAESEPSPPPTTAHRRGSVSVAARDPAMIVVDGRGSVRRGSVQHQQLTQEFLEKFKEKSEAIIGKQRDEIGTLQTELAAAARAMRRLEGQHEELQSQLAQAAGEHDAEQKRLAAANARLEQQLDDANGKLMQLPAQALSSSAADAAAKVALEAHCDVLEKANMALQQQLDRQHEAAQAAQASATTEIARLTGLLREAERAESFAEVSLTSHADLQRKAAVSAAKALAEARAEATLLQEALDESSRERRSLESTQRRQMEALAEATTASQQLQERVRLLESDLHDARSDAGIRATTSLMHDSTMSSSAGVQDERAANVLGRLHSMATLLHSTSPPPPPPYVTSYATGQRDSLASPLGVSHTALRTPPRRLGFSGAFAGSDGVDSATMQPPLAQEAGARYTLDAASLPPNTTQSYYRPRQFGDASMETRGSMYSNALGMALDLLVTSSPPAYPQERSWR